MADTDSDNEVGGSAAGADGLTKDSKEEQKSNSSLIASTMWELTKEAGGWSFGDLTLGMKYYKRAKIRERAAMTFDTSGELKDKAWVDDMRYWLDIIEATYQKNEDAVVAFTPHIKREDFIVADWKSTTLKPGYFVAKLPERQTIVFAIRGTANMKDALTDLTAAQEPWEETGRVHRGMIHAVNWFMANVQSVLVTALAENPGYSLKVVGHSLGGGTAGLSTLMLRKAGIDAKGIVIAPAAVLDLESARRSQEHITTFVLAEDMVPRFSVGAVDTLRKAIEEYPWGAEAMDSFKQTRLVKAYNGTKAGQSVNAGVSKAASATAAGAKAAANAASAGAKAATSSIKGMFKKKPAEEAAAPGAPSGEEVAPEARIAEDSVDPSSVAKAGLKGDETVTRAVDKDGKEVLVVDGDAIVKLYPPGTVFHIYRTNENTLHIERKDNDVFGEISLLPSLFSDHSSSNYITALKNISERLGSA